MKSVFLKFFILVTFIGAACFGYGLFIEPKTLEVRGPEFVSDKYSGPTLRLGIITDIHIGGLHVPARKVKQLVDEMNALQPDLVILPGDFVDGHVGWEDHSDAFNENLSTGIEFLSELNAPSYAVLGNHDAWYGSDKISSMLKTSGIKILKNEAQLFDDFCLVGLEDAWTGAPSVSAYEGCGPKTPLLVFTHSPNAWRFFRADSVLVIAGHTHGGQVNLPIIGRSVNAIELDAKHSYGFSRVAGVDMFVSAGVGTSRLPVRFRAPPEIVVITLRAAVQE